MPQHKATTISTDEAEAQLKMIHDFAGKNHATDPEHVTALLADAVEISREIGDIPMLIKSLWRRGIGLRVLLKEDEAVGNLQEALELAEKHASKNEVAGILETLGLTYYTFNRHKEAAYCHLKSAEVFAELGMIREQAKALSDVGAVLFVEGDLSSAIEFCRQGFALCQQHKLEPPLQLYHNSGLIYAEIGETSRALEFHLKALKEAEAMGHIQFQSTLISSVAAMYERNGDIELAYEYSKKAIGLHTVFHHPSTKILALVNSVDVLLLLGKLDEAERNIAEAYAIIEQHDFKAKKQYVLFIDGVLHKARRNFKKAHELFDEAFSFWEGNESRLKVKIYLEKARISKNKEKEALLLKALHDSTIIESREVQPDIYLALSEFYEAAGDTAAALKYHKMFHLLKEEIQGEKAKRHFQVIQVEHEAERKEKEAEILRLENEKLAQKLEYGKEQLSTLASYLTQKNQVLTAIQKSATNALKAKGSGQKNNLRLILKLSAESSEDFWEQFEKRFEAVYGDFHERLIRKHPDLSPMEVRVCILTRAGLPNKEIGELLSISNRTVESHRSSVRKKLDLDRTENLTSYLALL